MNEKFMKEAIKEAKIGLEKREIPIGCVIVKDDEIIATGFNKRNEEKNALYHAEIIAIDKACQHIGDWRLEDCTLYVTIEPCSMCAGAIIQARIPKVVFGARNKKAGCAGSVLDILNEEKFNHQVEVVEGVLEEECSTLMSDFFSNYIRKK